MESENPFLCHRIPPVDHILSQLNQSTSYFISLKSILILFSYLNLDIFPRGFSMTICNSLFPTRATCCVHLIVLEFITVIISGALVNNNGVQQIYMWLQIWIRMYRKFYTYHPKLRISLDQVQILSVQKPKKTAWKRHVTINRCGNVSHNIVWLTRNVRCAL